MEGYMVDNKVKQILLRVSVEEKEKIEEMAKNEGVSVTAFIKKKVLSYDISEVYLEDIQKKEDFLLQQIEELKHSKEEDRKHYRDWVEGMNRSLQLLNEEKEKLLERNNVLTIELDQEKNKGFFARLFKR